MEVSLWRYGCIWPIVAALLAGNLIGFLWWLPQLNKDRESEAKQVAQLTANTERQHQALPRGMRDEGEASALKQLKQASYSEDEGSDVLKRIARIAESEGVALTQSEFQSSSDGHGGLRQLQVSLPVTASYPKMRKFIEGVLLQLSGVSVDQIDLQRETIAQGQADIKIKLSIWIDPRKPASSGTLNHGIAVPGAVSPARASRARNREG